MALGTSALILQKLATVVSELARNQVLYAGGGKLVIRPCTGGRRCMHVIGSDKGGGIKNLPEIMSGKYKSRSGLGLGILGTKRLSDKFEIETGPTGTRIEVEVNY
jgi:serine/threonine-protein kinase RsbT